MNQAAEQPLKRSRTSQILAIYEHTRKRQHPHQRRTAAQPTARDRRAKARAAKDQPPKRGHKCQRPPSQLPKENQQRPSCKHPDQFCNQKNAKTYEYLCKSDPSPQNKKPDFLLIICLWKAAPSNSINHKLVRTQQQNSRTKPYRSSQKSPQKEGQNRLKWSNETYIGDLYKFLVVFVLEF
ncbi:hypothetical protein LXL04_034372 [Taraxacum kok-saghyz]